MTRDTTASERSLTRTQTAIVSLVAVVCILVAGATLVTAQETDGIIDDFEDDNTVIEADGWSGWNEESGSIATTDWGIDGEHSAELTPSGGESLVSASASSPASPDRVGARMALPHDGSGTRLRMSDGSTQVGFVVISSGEISVGEDGGKTVVRSGISPNQIWSVEMANIDWTNDEYDVVINGENEGTFGFRNTADEIDSIDVRDTSGEEIWIDDVSVGGDPLGEPDPADMGEFVDDFEDANVLDPTADNWGDWHGTLSDEFENTEQVVLSGEQSAVLSNENNATGPSARVILDRDDRVLSNGLNEIRYDIRFDSLSGETRLRIVESATSNDNIDAIFSDGGDIEVDFEGSTTVVGSYNADETITVQYLNISNNRFDFVVDGEDLGRYDFEDSTLFFDRVQIQHEKPGNVYVDDITFSTGDVGAPGSDDSEDLRLDVPGYLPHNSSSSYAVEANQSGEWVDVTGQATVTPDNTEALTFYPDNQTVVAGGNKSINERVNVTAMYDGLNATDYTVVATPTVDNLDLLPAWWSVNAVLSDWTMIWVLLATLMATAANRMATTFAGIGAFVMAMIMGWIMGDVPDGIMVTTIFMGLFIGLNLAANVDYSVR